MTKKISLAPEIIRAKLYTIISAFCQSKKITKSHQSLHPFTDLKNLVGVENLSALFAEVASHFEVEMTPADLTEVQTIMGLGNTVLNKIG